MERITDHIAIHLGDSLEMLRGLPDASIHCCVTDPPYGLKFMGKKWDYDVPSVELWREVLRALKPGGTLLSFAGSRTQHRMAVNIEDAGFKLCDTLLWLYGQGFPKGADIGKQLDKQLRVKFDKRTEDGIVLPVINVVKQWDGWKSHALKPAYEPIIMAMKPNDGSYANNALTHGVAGLHIDACRVGEGTGKPKPEYVPNDQNKVYGKNMGGGAWENTSGRYPANILHDGSDEVLAGFPETKSGARGGEYANRSKGGVGDFGFKNNPTAYGANSGSAARFFNELGWTEDELRFKYTAKASKADRGEGNTHPTVKPQALMQWLVRLVCPPDGVVLDPFMGSGTTGVACAKEGFDFLGSERDTDSYETAKRRLT